MDIRLENFLEPSYAVRVQAVLQKLSGCGLDYAVTGGLALEPSLGFGSGRRRSFNDIDVVASGFGALPSILGDLFMVSHAHPYRAEGKIILQLVDPGERVRIDIFSACGATLQRAKPGKIFDFVIKVVSVEDMACRIASEMMSFVRGETVSPKCADDHLRVSSIAASDVVELSWQDQRRQIDPMTYGEAAKQITEAVRLGTGILKKSIYSTDVESACPHCINTAPFEVARPQDILSVLGYC